MLIPTMAGADAQAGDSPRERTGPAWFIMSLVVVTLIIDGAVENGASRADKAIQQSFSEFCLAVYTIEMLLRIVGFGVWHSHPPPRPRAYFKRVACLLGKSLSLARAQALALFLSPYRARVQNCFTRIYLFIFQYLDAGRAPGNTCQMRRLSLMSAWLNGQIFLLS